MLRQPATNGERRVQGRENTISPTAARREEGAFDGFMRYSNQM